MGKQPSIVQIAPVLAVIFVLGGLCAGYTIMEEQKKKSESQFFIGTTAPPMYCTAPSGYRIIVRTRGHHGRCHVRREIGVFDSIDAY